MLNLSIGMPAPYFVSQVSLHGFEIVQSTKRPRMITVPDSRTSVPARLKHFMRPLRLNENNIFIEHY